MQPLHNSSLKSHLLVMENPDRISKAVLQRGLNAQTSILKSFSIDIADIDVGTRLQAEADVRVARAKAEERRAFAVAREQEMKAPSLRESGQSDLSRS